jgi:integrase
MGGKSVALPTGVELVGQSIRIRFMWNGSRRCETLAYPPTPQGVQAAAGLRTQVVQLAKLGMLSDTKYAELFPSSVHAAKNAMPTFGEYAQDWLNTRIIALNTRIAYKRLLNRYWMPGLAALPLDKIRPPLLRKIMASTKWSSQWDHKFAIVRLRSVFKMAVGDELLVSNPASLLEVPKVDKREIDPFTAEERDQIIDHLYATLHGRTVIWAAFFKFAFFTGARPGEILALRWGDVDFNRRSVRIRSTLANGAIKGRTKTGLSRDVLLADEAFNALTEARALTSMRGDFVFVGRSGDHIRSTDATRRVLKRALTRLGIRDRRQYDFRHTYATICLTVGMKPAFIAQQLGHSVQMLLDNYAVWANSDDDWGELAKLKSNRIGTKVVQPKTPPAVSD